MQPIFFCLILRAKIHSMLEETLLPYLGRTTKLIGLCILDEFNTNGIDLSKEQWLVLKYLHEKNGLIQNDLAFITDRSKTALTRLIQTMEKKNLVYRVSGKKDKRINRVFLTEKGENIFNASLPHLEKLMDILFEGLTPNQVTNTIQILEKVKYNTENRLKNSL